MMLCCLYPVQCVRFNMGDSSLKIGFLTSDLSHRSGWAHYSLSLLNALGRASVQVTVIAAHDSPPVENFPIARLLPSVSPLERFSLLHMGLSLPQVRAILQGCDLIHVTAEPYAPLGAWVAGKRPLVITGHGSYVHLPNLRGKWIGSLYRRAFLRAQMICVSRYTARVAESVTPGLRTTVINNGVDVERFADLPLAVGTRHAVSVEPHAATILTVGGVKARKGTLELVRAVARVRERLPDVQCVVIGSMDAEPGYAERVNAAIVELGMSDSVKMLGFVPEDALLGWYSAADVFVLPSINTGWKFEGYGLAHLEASACGLPVIGTTDCGAEDAIDDGATGLLVPQAQVDEALPQAILDVLTNPQRARQMGAAGREKARRQTWDHVGQQVMELYRTLLER
jgi:phosphatidylinositol alpha-1,6-mannosyltransferase